PVTQVDVGSDFRVDAVDRDIAFEPAAAAIEIPTNVRAVEPDRTRYVAAAAQVRGQADRRVLDDQSDSAGIVESARAIEVAFDRRAPQCDDALRRKSAI